MKKIRNLFAVAALMSVLGVGNAFAVGIIQGSPRPVSSSHSVSSLFGDVYDYFADLFAADDAEQTNDAGIIHTVKPKPGPVIPPSATNDAGVIPPTRP